MIFPALYAMAKRGDLTVPVIGVALPDWGQADLKKRVTESDRAGSMTNMPSTIFCPGSAMSAGTLIKGTR